VKRILGIAIVFAAGAAVFVFGIGAGNAGEYRVRAIFDTANQLTIGEQARVAGVTVGVVQTLDVTADNKAAVTLRIDNPAYQDFRTTAHCIIAPQSLIGEQYVDCTPMRPVAPGQPKPPALPVIKSGDGAGDRLLPVTNTSSPVGVDLLNNIMRVPERQRFALILNEFGTALAGNGQQLNAVIRRANPALQETDKVLAILASQNKTLAQLALDSDTSLAPLARDRAQVAGFIKSSEAVARASADAGQANQENFKRLPIFLAQLTPTMNALSSFSKSFGGFLKPLSGQTAQIDSLVSYLPAFAANSGNALASLGSTAVTGKTVLTDPAVLTALHGLNVMAKGLNPFANGLGKFLDNIKTTGGWEFLMQTLYAASGNGNAFNATGHYARSFLMLNADTNPCVTPNAYRSPFTYNGCSANFDNGVLPDSAASARIRKVAKILSPLSLLGEPLSALASPLGSSKSTSSTLLPQLPAGGSTTTTTPSSPATTEPATQPTTTTQQQQPQGKSAETTLMKYLLGGAK
jgi:ABC-type transporter Mla subunit MlaD